VSERSVVAAIIKANGAYMILNQTEASNDLTTIEQVDVAGSLVLAKRIAREMVEDVSHGPYRWEHEHTNLWHLLGFDEGWESYVADEDGGYPREGASDDD
jgi:hypothetical protein